MLKIPYIYKEIEVFDGDVDQYMSQAAKNGQIWDSWMIPFLAMACRVPGAFIDVGANIGLDTVLFSCFAPTLAFEPVHFDMLKNNSQNTFLPVEVSEFALSDTDGEGTVYMYQGPNKGANSMEHPEFTGGSQTVQTRKLDSIIGDVPVSFIKIDVEGHEYKVLDGAKGTIERCHPMMCVETFDTDRIREYARDMKYDLHEMPEHNFIMIYRGDSTDT